MKEKRPLLPKYIEIEVAPGVFIKMEEAPKRAVIKKRDYNVTLLNLTSDKK